jgi:glycosyltransferase involved in cell wall biosynthesis
MAIKCATLADARWLGAHGIGRFAQNVLSRLRNCEQLSSGPRPLSPLDPLWLTYQIATKRPAVFFSPGFNAPALSMVPLVFTIHDLAHLQLPVFATYRRRLYYRCLVKPASNRAYRVITVSEYSRTHILEWTGLPETCVVNVGNGVEPIFRPEGWKYEPGFPYILHVGAFRPHKNITRLFKAFAKIDYPSLRLILTGKKTLELTAQLQDLRIENRVEFTGCVTDDMLAALYRGAVCLVSPSLMEGFGLPALEAMASGIPVIVSRNTAAPEVVGNAAILIDPLQVDDIRAAMERILSDAQLRQSLRKAGLRRAELFCWNRVAEKVQRVIDEAREASS